MSKSKKGNKEKNNFLTPEQIKSGSVGRINLSEPPSFDAVHDMIGTRGLDFLNRWSREAKEENNKLAAANLELIFEGVINFGPKFSKAKLYIAVLRDLTSADILPEPESLSKLIGKITIMDDKVDKLKQPKTIDNKKEGPLSASQKAQINTLNKKIDTLVTDFMKTQLGVKVSGRKLG